MSSFSFLFSNAGANYLMNVLRTIAILLIGLMSPLTYAQNNLESLPSILSFLLEQNDTTEVDLQSELRFRETREFSEQDGDLLSITTPSYDSSGRVISQVQQLFDNGGEIESFVNTSIEYDILGRAVSASSVVTEVEGGPPASIETTFSYFPLEFRLREVVITNIAPDGSVGGVTQQFEYDTVDRVSQVVSVLSGPFGDVSVIDVPIYAGSRIISVSKTITSLAGISTINTTLGYNATEQISTTIDRGSSIEVINSSFTSGVQTTRRGLPGQRFRDVTEYENGICDLSNEENRRLLSIFDILSPSGLGRQCR